MSFDAVCSREMDQSDVFELGQVSDMLDKSLQGYHATIFAYGHTGSGKTYTMEGYEYFVDADGIPTPDFETNPSHFGITPRVINMLFQKITEASSYTSVKIRCSYIQIYNENVFDLLNPQYEVIETPGCVATTVPQALKVRWSKRDEFFVENQTLYDCQDAREMRKVFQLGVRNKIRRSHALNNVSNRSHCLFSIYIESRSLETNEPARCSRLTLVDLAGSERISLTGVVGQARKEAVEINRSLLVLGKVISALDDRNRMKSTMKSGPSAKSVLAHVPYRDSKLTQLLKHSLGGSAITLMIACVSPGMFCAEDNISTLKYAARARNIRNRPVVNEDPAAAAVRDLQAEVQRLKAELAASRAVQTSGNLPPTGKIAAASVGRDGLETVDSLGSKLAEAMSLMNTLVDNNGVLRERVEYETWKNQELSHQVEELVDENGKLRNRLLDLEGMLFADPSLSNSNMQMSNFSETSGDVMTRSGLMVELLELRRQNRQLLRSTAGDEKVGHKEKEKERENEKPRRSSTAQPRSRRDSHSSNLTSNITTTQGKKKALTGVLSVDEMKALFSSP
jgi:hypothetical protein